VPFCTHVGTPVRCALGTGPAASKRIPAELVAYMKTGSGSHKVLFGTNYPMIPHLKALDGLDALGLDDETRAHYLGGNAARVFNLRAGTLNKS